MNEHADKDIEIRVKQRNLALNDYIVLKLDDMEILHASPVRRVDGEVRKQPEVDIQCGDYGLHILNRSVLFRFMKSIDPDLKYTDFNRFLDHFDLKTMLDDFIISAPGMSIPVWTLGDEITAIDDGAWQTNSKYLLTIHDELLSIIILIMFTSALLTWEHTKGQPSVSSVSLVSLRFYVTSKRHTLL